MDALVKTGRVLFAAAIAFFGVECLVFAAGGRYPLPGPPWTQGHIGLAWIAGLGFLVTAICIALPWQGRLAANVLGTGVLLRGLFVDVPQLAAHPHDPRPWTSTFEVLAICGAAFVIARTIPVELASHVYSRSNAMDVIATIGRSLFAVSLVVFGVQHFMYAQFVGMLIPEWIPWHLFWVYAAGVVFFTVAASLMLGRMVWVSSAMLAAMFLLWVLVLHAPRVLHALHNGDEWTSAAIALAMGGASLGMTGALGDRRTPFA